MFERILVPLDGSPRAEAILSLISRILTRRDSEIVLLRAIDIPAPLGGVGLPDMRAGLADVRRQELESAQSYIDQTIRRFAGTGVRVNGRIAEGAPAEAILSASRTEGATLIAMSTHGRSGIARWTMGSVAEKVARASDVPVLFVRSFRRTPAGQLDLTSREEIPFERILVPVDGSPTSMSVLPAAEKFAQLYGSRVLVLHVETPYAPTLPILPGMDVAVPSAIPPATPSEKDDVTAPAAARFAQAGLPVTRITVQGEPASQILDQILSQRADLIALGTHGRSGLARWAMGSVAERVLRSAEVPLLVVRTAASRKDGG